MALTLSAIVNFFVEEAEKKSIHRGEQHYKAGHVEMFSYAKGEMNGFVRASQRNRVYKVSVSSLTTVFSVVGSQLS